MTKNKMIVALIIGSLAAFGTINKADDLLLTSVGPRASADEEEVVYAWRFDTSTTLNVEFGTSSYTNTHTAGTLTNAVLVAMTSDEDTDSDTTNVTCNGVNMNALSVYKPNAENNEVTIWWTTNGVTSGGANTVIAFKDAACDNTAFVVATFDGSPTISQGSVSQELSAPATSHDLAVPTTNSNELIITVLCKDIGGGSITLVENAATGNLVNMANVEVSDHDTVFSYEFATTATTYTHDVDFDSSSEATLTGGSLRLN